jgi:ornithine cyclodeaminase/alanine dehydrogenase-like protein (mu-crystallin family)
LPDKRTKMSNQAPLWISEADVVSVMDMKQAISALEKGLRAEAEGQAQNMLKTHIAWGDGSTLHAIGASFAKDGFAGTKTWAHTKGGAAPLLILFDSENGSVKAIIEAFALGQMRTASVSGLATKLLAEQDASDFAIIGTGKQALIQVAAVLAVRPISRIRVYSRNEDRRKEFASRVEKEFQIEVIAANSVAGAVEGVSTITLVTRAKDPVISGKMIRRGAHINAVGAIEPSRAEIDQDVLERCTRIVVDNVPQAQKLSRELNEFLGSPEREGWNRVTSLANLIAANRVREFDDDITLLKSLGMGISDLALGIEVYRLSVVKGLGRCLPDRQRAEPRLSINSC